MTEHETNPILDATDTGDAPLSADALVRKDEILALAQRASHERARRRRIARAAPLAVVLIALAGLPFLLPSAPAKQGPIADAGQRTPDTPETPGVPTLPESPDVVIVDGPASVPTIRRVATTGQGVQRIDLPAERTGVRRISDAELVEALRAAGQPSGVVRTPDAVRIVPVDAPISEPESRTDEVAPPV